MYILLLQFDLMSDVLFDPNNGVSVLYFYY